MPGIERYHAALHGSYRLTPATEAYAEFLYGASHSDQIFGPPLSVSGSLRAWDSASQSLTPISNALPAGNPSNPNASPTPFTANLFDLGQRNKTDSVSFRRLLLGVKGSGERWDWDVSGLYSDSRLREYAYNFVNRYAYEQLLANGGYNFIDPSRNSEAVRDSLRIRTMRPPGTASPAWTPPPAPSWPSCRPAGGLRRRLPAAARNDEFRHLVGSGQRHGAAAGAGPDPRRPHHTGGLRRVQRADQQDPQPQRRRPRRPLQRLRQRLLAQAGPALPAAAKPDAARLGVARLPRAVAAGNHQQHRGQLRLGAGPVRSADAESERVLHSSDHGESEHQAERSTNANLGLVLARPPIPASAWITTASASAT
ncbi:Uncharacterised protein [Chromobacterium violaceum]|uniref:Uncharacterized protein n=1 Tax=Chromobacterium violaceum TaxID=536 RepID=A0A3S4I619_CHRVL|nr:Uncharacterised protein [Chromobacterium violaceum]